MNDAELKQDTTVVTRGFLASVLEAIGKSTSRAIDARLEKKMSLLEKRIQELERKSVEFRGVYVDGELYAANDLVQRSGSLWISLRGTYGIPGKSPDWKLCVKNGTLRDE